MTVRSCGSIELYFKTPDFMHEILVIYVLVLVDIPELLGLDVLYAYGSFVDTINN